MATIANVIALSEEIVYPQDLLKWTRELMKLNMSARRVVVDRVGDKLDGMYDWLACCYITDFVESEEWARGMLEVLETNVAE